MTAGTLNKLDKKIEKLDPTSLRYRVLVAIRQFRSSWIEVGRLLNDVVYGQDYREWGYEEFEVYCARELGLKKPTVQKLLNSYNYMKTHEPDRLRRYDEAGATETIPNIPDYQTVDLLHRARTRDTADESTLNELHERSFAGEYDEGDLRNELRDYMRSDGDENGGNRNNGDSRERHELVKILRASRNLRQLLAATEVIPEELKGRIESLLVELEGMA